MRLVCGRGSSTYLELGKGQRRRCILCLFLVFGACPSRGDDCKPHRSGPSDGRGGFLSSIRFKDPLVPQGALEKELGGFYSKRGPIRAKFGAKTPGGGAPVRREVRVRVTLDLQAAQSDGWVRGSRRERGGSRVAAGCLLAISRALPVLDHLSQPFVPIAAARNSRLFFGGRGVG